MSKMSVSEEQQCWEKWLQSRDDEAGNTLIRKYMPLVSYHVQRIASTLPKNVLKDDLVSLAMFGLYDALEKFDPSRDLKFDTYASFRIRGAIIDGLRKEDWLPRSVREKAKKIDQASELIEQREMRPATVEEIAVAVEMTVDEVLHVVNEGIFAHMVSLDEPMRDDDEKETTIAIRDERTLTPEQMLTSKENIGELAQHIKRLTENEQLVLSLFYYEELTFTEIGQILNLSTSRISQIHAKAIFKLRKVLTN